jgi:hypothetical protein
MPVKPGAMPKRKPTTLQVLHTVADLLIDLSASFEHPGYIQVPDGPLLFIFGRDGDRYRYEVWLHRQYLAGEQPVAVSDRLSELSSDARPIVIERWIRRTVAHLRRQFADRS